jgi:hypothetical protein
VEGRDRGGATLTHAAAAFHYLGGNVFSRLQRTLHISAPYGGGLGTGPVDAADPARKSWAAGRPAARAEVRSRSAAGPPTPPRSSMFGVVLRLRGARTESAPQGRRQNQAIHRSSRRGASCRSEGDRAGIGDRLAAEPVVSPERLLVQSHALGEGSGQQPLTELTTLLQAGAGRTSVRTLRSHHSASVSRSSSAALSATQGASEPTPDDRCGAGRRRRPRGRAIRGAGSCRGSGAACRRRRAGFCRRHTGRRSRSRARRRAAAPRVWSEPTHWPPTSTVTRRPRRLPKRRCSQPWAFSPRSSISTNFLSRRSHVSGFFASPRR